ncbi:MAG: hypothetical protein SFY81_04805 [Verrucomicrobiota bacterium]|nr:hypothetical protein [Verrucomicrobiota bacterium]
MKRLKSKSSQPMIATRPPHAPPRPQGIGVPRQRPLRGRGGAMTTPLPYRSSDRQKFIDELAALLTRYDSLFQPIGVRLTVTEVAGRKSDQELRDIIVDYLSTAYDIDRHVILQTHSRSRRQAEAEARSLAMIFLQEFRPLRDAQVAPLFGLHPDSVRHARKVVANLCHTKPTFKSNVRKMRDELHQLIGAWLPAVSRSEPQPPAPAFGTLRRLSLRETLYAPQSRNGSLKF